MSDFRKVAHLQEQLGDERFQVLISSDNTGKFKALCDEIIEAALPTEMTVGDRTYGILGFLQGDEEYVKGDVMEKRVEDMKANLGKEDGEHILEHQDDIPPELRGKVVFVFTDWHHPDSPEFVCVVCWRGDRWLRYWGWLDDDWGGNYRVLRRK